jgi:hypothetical protein
VLSLRERAGIFDFRDHLEQTADFDDCSSSTSGSTTATGCLGDVGLGPEGDAARLRPAGPPLKDEDATPRKWVKRIPLPPTARKLFGANAALRLTVQDREGHGAATLAAPQEPGPDA